MRLQTSAMAVRPRFGLMPNIALTVIFIDRAQNHRMVPRVKVLPMRATSASPLRFPLRGAACLASLALGFALTAGPGRAAHENVHMQTAAVGVQPDVMLESSLFVEHTRQNARGLVHMLEPAKQVSTGDRVVTLLSWYRLGGSGGFIVTEALPSGMSWEPGDKDEAEVSVDGGHTWGHLGKLRIGQRIAGAQDVTHMRWHISPAQALAGSGRIAYAGMVR